MFQRWSREFGLWPGLGILLGVFAFIGATYGLFWKVPFAAPALYMLLAIIPLYYSGEKERNDFLKGIFLKKDYSRIRILENLLVTIPFFIGLLCYGVWIYALGLLVIAIYLALIPWSPKWGLRIPSPFAHFPFEFTVGFRKTLGVHLLLYLLTFMSIRVDNFNLGIFALLVMILTCLSYYANPERVYFVWIYSRTPAAFLFEKFKIATSYLILACFPILLALMIAFSSNIWILLGLLILGIFFMLTIILAKYSVFPKVVNVPQALLLAIGFSFPPFLLFLIPFFYKKAISRLHYYLE